MLKLEGVYTVLPTPFTEHDKVDLASLRRVIDLFINDGVSGFTALGVTSEVARLGDGERMTILEAVMEHVDGRVPVIVGATADGLHGCIERSREAEAAGAEALMISPPRMAKLNSDVVLRHFASVAEAVQIPIVVQDFPPISGYSMEPWLLVRIARDIPAARMIKLEDAPTPNKAARIRAEAQGIPVGIFGGLGGAYLLEELIAGVSGAMTGFAYPSFLVEVVDLFHAGGVDEAADAFYRHVPLMRFEFQEGIGMAIRKEILLRRGALTSARVRPPGGQLDPKTRQSLERVLDWMGLEPGR